MTNVDPEPNRPRFTLHGPVLIWDPVERRLNLGGRDLWLEAHVPTNHLDLGRGIVAQGYEGAHGERIVDSITISTFVDSWRRRSWRSRA
jgi:hypothetical protein